MLPPLALLEQRVKMLLNARVILAVMVVQMVIKVMLIRTDTNVSCADHRGRHRRRFGWDRECRQSDAANNKHGDDSYGR